MKKLLITISTVFLISCGNVKKLNNSQMEKFSISNDTLFYMKKPVAVYTSVEWEYYRGKKTLEISVDRINGGMDNMVDTIVNFIHTKHPKCKAEVKSPKK